MPDLWHDHGMRIKGEAMSVVKCRAVSVRIAESLRTATVTPRTGDEEMALRFGINKENISPRDALDVKDEVYDSGIAVMLENVKNGNQYERFFPEIEVRRVAGVGRRLTDEEMLSFGNSLIARREPIPIGVFDKEVPVDRVIVKHHPR